MTNWAGKREGVIWFLLPVLFSRDLSVVYVLQLESSHGMLVLSGEYLSTSV